MLSQSLVTRYGKYRALKNLLDKWLDNQKEIILAAFKRNPRMRCPQLGPFLLELGSSEDRANWKDEFFDYLVDDVGKKRALRILDKIAGRTRPQVPRLHCKKNPNFKRKFPIRLPA